jgi:hypothetical protein
MFADPPPLSGRTNAERIVLMRNYCNFAAWQAQRAAGGCAVKEMNEAAKWWRPPVFVLKSRNG